jgi:hypothetical protein
MRKCVLVTFLAARNAVAQAESFVVVYSVQSIRCVWPSTVVAGCLLREEYLKRQYTGSILGESSQTEGQ